MTLYELSGQYRIQADLLGERIRLLKRQELEEEDETERLRLHDRVRILTSMWRDTRDVAVLTEFYYERSRSRNGKYIL